MKIRFLLAAVLTVASFVPALSHAQSAYAVTADNRLITFDLSNPANTLSQIAITGLVTSDGTTADPSGTLFELALDSETGIFYGLDGNANFYSLDVGTGAATLVSSTFSPTGFDAGLDYDPFTSALRFVSDAAENVVITTAGVPTTLAPTVYGVGDPNVLAAPTFVGLAIDPDFGTTYSIDSTLGILAQSFDPGLGEFFTVGSLGLSITGYASLTILDGSLFAALSTDGFNSSLYSIDSLTGSATKIGDFAGGINALVAVPEPAAFLVIFPIAACIFLKRRKTA